MKVYWQKWNTIFVNKFKLVYNHLKIRIVVFLLPYLMTHYIYIRSGSSSTALQSFYSSPEWTIQTLTLKRAYQVFFFHGHRSFFYYCEWEGRALRLVEIYNLARCYYILNTGPLTTIIKVIYKAAYYTPVFMVIVPKNTHIVSLLSSCLHL